MAYRSADTSGVMSGPVFAVVCRASYPMTPICRARLARAANRTHQRVVQVERLTGMNTRALLRRVEFVHLERGEDSDACRRSDKTFVPTTGRASNTRNPRCCSRPAVNRPVGARKPYIDPNVGALRAPAQDEWQVIGIRESAAAADLAVNVRCQIVFREGQSGGRGVSRSENPLRAHPGQRVHIHHDRVEAGYGKRSPVIVLGLIARIEEQLVRVGEPGLPA